MPSSSSLARCELAWCLDVLMPRKHATLLNYPHLPGVICSFVSVQRGTGADRGREAPPLSRHASGSVGGETPAAGGEPVAGWETGAGGTVDVRTGRRWREGEGVSVFLKCLCGWFDTVRNSVGKGPETLRARHENLTKRSKMH